MGTLHCRRLPVRCRDSTWSTTSPRWIIQRYRNRELLRIPVNKWVEVSRVHARSRQCIRIVLLGCFIKPSAQRCSCYRDRYKPEIRDADPLPRASKLSLSESLRTLGIALVYMHIGSLRPWVGFHSSISMVYPFLQGNLDLKIAYPFGYDGGGSHQILNQSQLASSDRCANKIKYKACRYYPWPVSTYGRFDGSQKLAWHLTDWKWQTSNTIMSEHGRSKIFIEVIMNMIAHNNIL